MINPDGMSPLQYQKMLLVDSDWTQLPDVPLTAEKKAVWAQYRQQVRDAVIFSTGQLMTNPDVKVEFPNLPTFSQE